MKRSSLDRVERVKITNKMLFHKLALEAFCHATEDPNKVKRAMLNLLPPNEAARKISEQRLEGSFGNEIRLLAMSFERQGEINKILNWIKKNLPKKEMEDFDFDEHVTDNCEFWMRFDKQAAYRGEFTLGSRDTIQLKGKVAAFPAEQAGAVKLMQDFWG